MPVKPTILSTWSTDGGTRLEPSAGEKAVGYSVSDQPPARWWNFKFGNLFDWINFLNAPVGTGSTAPIDAQGGTGNAAGLIGRGGATGGNGVEGHAGGIGFGGRFLGAAASVSAVEGLAATGSNGGGGRFFAAGSGDGIRANGELTGDGVVGLSGTVSGYGAKVEGRGTNSSLRMIPQTLDPTGPNASGDTYVNSTTGKLRSYNGQEWERHRPQVTVFQASDVEIISNTTAQTPYVFTYSIKANTLVVGSVIDILVFGTVLGSANGGNVTFDLQIAGGTIGIFGPVTLSDFPFLWKVRLLITSIGSSGDFSISEDMEYFTRTIFNAKGNAINTTIANLIDFQVTMTVAGAGNSIQLQGFKVDIS